MNTEIEAFEAWRKHFLAYGVTTPKLGNIGTELNGAWPRGTWLQRRLAHIKEQQAQELRRN